MLKLSKKDLLKAEEFLRSQARPLEQALFATFIHDAPAQRALGELAQFQNSDGGFGHGLEPDLQMAGSSILATTIALQHIRDLKASVDHPLVRGAMRYLVQTYDSDAQAWPFVPPEVTEAPRAPWWQYHQDLRQFLANPRAEIIGYLFQFPDLFPAKERHALLADVCSYLDEHHRSLKMHEILCYVRLIETDNLPAVERDYLGALLEPLILSEVATDPKSWDDYVESTELNTPLKNNQRENAVVEVTDPYHPLYGRRFPIISISSGSCNARSVLVINAAGKERQLRIPIQATKLVIRPQSIRTKITLAAITDLISTTGEVDIWKGQQTQCGDDYLPPDEARL